MSLRPLLRPRLVIPVLAWALVLGLLPQPAGAAPLPPAAASAAAADLGALETRLVTARLVALGVSPEDAAARIAALTAAERHELAQRLDELEPGGSAAAALAIVIVVGLLVVLILELMGRRVISRP
jgi:hypothetical protein